MSHPASRLRLLAHGIAELPPDINGEIDGPEYRTILTIKELRAKLNNREESQSVWCGRKLSLASGEEEHAFWVMEGDWNILSVREGYWYSNRGAEGTVLAGERPNRVNVATLDFVTTRAPTPPDRRLRYEALSSKPISQWDNPAVVLKHDREQAYCASRGWGWRRLDPPPEQSVENHRALRRMVLPVSWVIDDANDDARELATQLYCTSSTKPLNRLLAMLGKRLGISENDQNFVFAAAYYLGYLGLDHSKPLDPYKPLSLAPSPRWNRPR